MVIQGLLTFGLIGLLHVGLVVFGKCDCSNKTTWRGLLFLTVGLTVASVVVFYMVDGGSIIVYLIVAISLATMDSNVLIPVLVPAMQTAVVKEDNVFKKSLYFIVIALALVFIMYVIWYV